MTGTTTELIREARDADADGLIALIGSVFDEYPGCVLDVDGEMPHLRRIATSYSAWGGRFWVAERDGRVVGAIGLTDAGVAATPAIPATLARPGAAAEEVGRGAEIHHLYIRREARRAGLGGRLLALAEAEAQRRAAGFVELWSDTRFEDAHRFYLNRGYARLPETRELHDLSGSVEYHFIRRL